MSEPTRPESRMFPPSVPRFHEPRIQESSASLRVSPAQRPTLSLAAAVRSLRPLSVPAQRRHRRALRLLAGVAALTLLVGSGERPEPFIVSGRPQLKYTDSGDIVRWHTRSVTLTIDPSLDSIGRGAREAVLLGFDAWFVSHPKLPEFSIDMASQHRTAERDGVNLVTLDEIRIPGYQNALAVTTAYSLSSTGEIVEADTIINARAPFALVDLRGSGEAEHGRPASGSNEHGEASDCTGAYDLQSVAAHEAGHFFGLGEDRLQTEATMYYKTPRCDMGQRDLFDSDVEAIDFVYSEETLPEPTNQAGVGCSVAAAGPGSSAGWGLLVLALWSIRRRA